MSRDLVSQALVNLFVTGSLYALVALGLSLIFSIMQIINFAHAQMYMLGAFGLYFFYDSVELAFAPSVVLAVVSVGALGVVIDFALLRHLYGDPLRSMVATLGLLLVLGGLALLVFGPNEKFIAPPLAGIVTVAGGVVSVQKLVAVATSAVLIGGLFGALRWSKLGRAMRAAAQDREGAGLQGINVRRLNSAAIAVGSALAAAAGALILPLTTAVDTGVGDELLPKMFIIVILGGLGSIEGAVGGAFLLAAIEVVGFTFFGEFAILAAYLAVVGILLARPTGIFGRAAL